MASARGGAGTRDPGRRRPAAAAGLMAVLLLAAGVRCDLLGGGPGAGGFGQVDPGSEGCGGAAGRGLADDLAAGDGAADPQRDGADGEACGGDVAAGGGVVLAGHVGDGDGGVDD